MIIQTNVRSGGGRYSNNIDNDEEILDTNNSEFYSNEINNTTSYEQEENNEDYNKLNIIEKIKLFFTRSFNNKFKNLNIKYKKDPKKAIAIFIAVLGLFSCLIGTSFSYLTYVSKTNNSTVIKAGTLALTFKNESSGIYLNNALPQSDEEGLANESEYSFEIENTGTIASTYKLTLDNTCTLDKSYSIEGVSLKPDKCIPNEYIKVAIKEGDSSSYQVIEKKKKDLTKGEGQVNGAVQTKEGMNFDGADDYIDMGNTNYDFGNKLTVAARFKTSSFKTGGTALIDNYSYSNGKATGFELFVAGNGRIVLQFFSSDDNSRKQIYTSSATELDKWYVVAATYDGSNVKIYLNGKLEKTVVLSPDEINAINTINPLYIGANPHNGPHFVYNGTISDALVINDVLTEEEIQTNYSSSFSYQENEKTAFYQNWDGDESYVLDAGSINSGEVKTYKMKVWLDYNTPNTYNSKGKLNVIYSGKLGLSYEQGVNSYSAGDIITLKDGSKWFYLTSDGYYANLLSLNMVDENGEFVDDAWNAIKMNFSNDNSSDYETSDVKKFIDTKVALSIKQNLKKNGVSGDIINDIDISILDAKIVSDIGQIDSWTPSAQGYFSIGIPSRYFLANRSLTYWTKTAKNANYVWIVNKSNNFWYGQAGSTNNLFGVKPMITVKLNNIKNIENVVENPELSAISSPKYLVYDVTNKKIILEKNDARNDIWHPASLTKLTTAIVAIEEMEKQNISLDDKITITDEVMSMVPSGASVAGFKAGDVVTYRDLLYGTIHKSGGDACYVLAESLAGSTASFVQFMNDFATTNNMTNTHYTNTTGLINTNYQHYSSLRDVAIGFAEAMKNDTFREVLKPIEYTTSNGLVFPIPEFGTLPYVIGLKNGHATYYDKIKSGYNQAIYYQKGSREYIVVTSSSPDDKTMEHRTTDNYLLWKWLF